MDPFISRGSNQVKMRREVVLVGRSNVGKSTLFRSLTGKNVRVGKRPGITLAPTEFQLGRLIYVDMPGYGFMLRRGSAEQERVKDVIVRYIEEHSSTILVAVEVIDASSFLEIADRWEKRGEVPVEVEMFGFLEELGLDPVLAANKMDRIANPDQALDWIVDRLGMPSPWTQWSDRVAPISAKRGEIEALQAIIHARSQSRS